MLLVFMFIIRLTAFNYWHNGRTYTVSMTKFVDFQLREYNGSVNGVHGNGTYEPLPEITVCTLDTVLVWVPCGFLLLISPLYLYHLFSLKTRGTATWLNITKTVSYCLLKLYRIPYYS